MTTQTIFSYDEAAAFILPSDKFQGKTLAQAYKEDRQYVQWLAKQMRPTHDVGRQVKAAAIAYLAGPQTNTPAQAPKPTNGHSNGRKPAPQARSNGYHKPAPAHNGGQKNQGEHPRIFSLVTNKAILHLEDALSIDKVKFFMVAYQRGKGASATVIHYMNVDDARVLAADLALGRLPSQKYVEYKGSPTARDGKPLSRVLKVGDRGDQSNRPIVIQVQNGPGKLMGEGAIKPAGDPDAEVTIFLTRWEARKLGHALQSYLLAWQTARMTLTPPETITG